MRKTREQKLIKRNAIIHEVSSQVRHLDDGSPICRLHLVSGEVDDPIVEHFLWGINQVADCSR